MKKTMLFRIIKNINLNKLISNICELYDYTTYYDYDKISLIQTDIQQFIYMVRERKKKKKKKKKEKKIIIFLFHNIL